MISNFPSRSREPKTFPAHPRHPTANREGFPDPHPLSQGCVLCPFCNNLEPTVTSIIRLTKTLDCLQRQTSPPEKLYKSSLPSLFLGTFGFLVLWMETNKHTNMSHTGFQSNLIIFNAVQFFGFHHKISTFSYSLSATTKATITSTTTSVFIK